MFPCGQQLYRCRPDEQKAAQARRISDSTLGWVLRLQHSLPWVATGLEAKADLQWQQKVSVVLPYSAPESRANCADECLQMYTKHNIVS